MPDERDLRAHFEAILGRGLVGGEVVLLRERVALHAWHRDAAPSGQQSVFPGGVTSREIGTTGSSTKGCGKHDVLDVGGRSLTGRDGTVEFLLSDFYCPPRRGLALEEPVTIVATPQSETAVYLTTRRRLVGPSGGSFNDVSIRVTAWDSDGNSAGPVSFDWRCFVPTLLFPVID
jgi:hypothetical protein